MMRQHKSKLTCAVCDGPDRALIDNELINGSKSYRKLGRQYGVRFTAIHAHFHNHLKPELERARSANQEGPESHQDSLLRPVTPGPAAHTPAT